MRTSACEKVDVFVQVGLEFLDNLFSDYDPLDFSVRFWEGTTWGSGKTEEVAFSLVIKHPWSLRRMFLRGDQLSMGEAFIFDDFDVEGNLEASFRIMDYLSRRSPKISQKLRLRRQLMQLPPGKPKDVRQEVSQPKGWLHSKKRDAQAVAFHYNVSSEFFRLWLDQQMCYSCGYFQSPGDSLDDAQTAKLDYICRKLRLRPGEFLLDIGCGWGALILKAARDYGVKALGITLSAPQAEWAQKSIQEAGLEKKCHAEVADYRDLNEWGRFDKIVSVGMVEHVGRKKLGDYFKRAYDLLKSGGLFLNHGIIQQPGGNVFAGPSFIDQYVFPDGELLPLTSHLRSAEKYGFEIRDVESLREHYRLTLQHWVGRLEKAHSQAVILTDETTYRIWRLYMAGSAFLFGKNVLNIYQALLVKPINGASGLPLTRSDLYS